MRAQFDDWFKELFNVDVASALFFGVKGRRLKPHHSRIKQGDHHE
jgi:hypothetical protein